MVEGGKAHPRRLADPYLIDACGRQAHFDAQLGVFRHDRCQNFRRRDHPANGEDIQLVDRSRDGRPDFRAQQTVADRRDPIGKFGQARFDQDQFALRFGAGNFFDRKDPHLHFADAGTRPGDRRVNIAQAAAQLQLFALNGLDPGRFSQTLRNQRLQFVMAVGQQRDFFLHGRPLCSHAGNLFANLFDGQLQLATRVDAVCDISRMQAQLPSQGIGRIGRAACQVGRKVDQGLAIAFGKQPGTAGFGLDKLRLQDGKLGLRLRILKPQQDLTLLHDIAFPDIDAGHDAAIPVLDLLEVLIHTHCPLGNDRRGDARHRRPSADTDQKQRGTDQTGDDASGHAFERQGPPIGRWGARCGLGGSKG